MTSINPDLLLSALLSWSAQFAILAAAGALASLAIAHPKARLAMWQTLLAAALLLPFLEPWKSPPAAPLATVDFGSVTIATAPAAPHAASFHITSQSWLWLIGLVAGLRLIWVGAGLIRLRHYRKQARPLPVPLRFADAISWYWSDAVSGPVTYGWRQPVILLPSRVLDLPATLREAVQCHELVHVRRSDWLWVLGETMLRCLLWFHPAFWFVHNRIQLAREQAVDLEAVNLLQNREIYLDALAAVASHQLQPDFAPAFPLAFLKKRQLLARIEAVTKEMSMSRSRIAAGCAAACSVLAAAALAAIWFFPFVGAPAVEAQTTPDSPGVTVDAGGTLLHRAPVRISSLSPTGTIVLQATIDAKGEVSDARVISGPEELRKQTLSSVLQWHYQPGPSSAQISIQFEAPAANPSAANPSTTSATAPPPPPGTPGARAAISFGSTPAFPATVKTIRFMGLSADAEQQLRSRLNIREGDTISESDFSTLNSALKAFDSHLSVGLTRSGAANGASEIGLTVRVQSEAVPEGGVRQAAPVQAAKLTFAPKPAYPPIARQARIQGAVVLNVQIATDGTVNRVTVVSSSNPLLTPAAMDAVKQWVYQPTILNGQPTEVNTQVTINFSLDDGTAGGSATPAGVYRPGGDVSNPIPIKQVQPEYSEQARQAKWGGTVLVSVVVDETGVPGSIKIVKPLGMGLDEKAIEAVSQWRFSPGMKNGVAVPVQATIEVTFRLQ